MGPLVNFNLLGVISFNVKPKGCSFESYLRSHLYQSVTVPLPLGPTWSRRFPYSLCTAGEPLIFPNITQGLFDLIDIGPAPALARLERLDDRAPSSLARQVSMRKGNRHRSLSDGRGAAFHQSVPNIAGG
jgi:hypothetical protein